MFEKVVQILFGCRHRNYSFPVTIKTGAPVLPVCTSSVWTAARNCRYDWSRMRVAGAPAAEFRPAGQPRAAFPT